MDISTLRGIAFIIISAALLFLNIRIMDQEKKLDKAEDMIRNVEYNITSKFIERIAKLEVKMEKLEK